MIESTQIIRKTQLPIISNQSNRQKQEKTKKARETIDALRKLLQNDFRGRVATIKEVKYGWEIEDRKLVYVGEINMLRFFSCHLKLSWEMQNHVFKITIDAGENRILTTDTQASVCSKPQDAAQTMFELFQKNYIKVIEKSLHLFSKEAEILGIKTQKILRVV